MYPDKIKLLFSNSIAILLAMIVYGCNNAGSIDNQNILSQQNSIKTAISTAEENKVYFRDKVINVSFTESGHSITSDEDWGGISSEGLNGLLVLADGGFPELELGALVGDGGDVS